MLTCHPITQEEKQEICTWRYPGEYSIYNQPPYQEMVRRGYGYCNPQREGNFFSFREDGRLVGFVNLLEEQERVFVGIGVAPQLCGRGYGRAILALAGELSRRRSPGKPLYLEVRSWNRRAISCYRRAGFSPEAEVEKSTPPGSGPVPADGAGGRPPAGRQPPGGGLTPLPARAFSPLLTFPPIRFIMVAGRRLTNFYLTISVNR